MGFGGAWRKKKKRTKERRVKERRMDLRKNGKEKAMPLKIEKIGALGVSDTPCLLKVQSFLSIK